MTEKKNFLLTLSHQNNKPSNMRSTAPSCSPSPTPTVHRSVRMTPSPIPASPYSRSWSSRSPSPAESASSRGLTTPVRTSRRFQTPNSGLEAFSETSSLDSRTNVRSSARAFEKKGSSFGLVNLGTILVVSALIVGVNFAGIIHVSKPALQIESANVIPSEGNDATEHETNSLIAVNGTEVKIEWPSQTNVLSASIDSKIEVCDTKVFCLIILSWEVNLTLSFVRGTTRHP